MDMIIYFIGNDATGSIIFGRNNNNYKHAIINGQYNINSRK